MRQTKKKKIIAEMIVKKRKKPLTPKQIAMYKRLKAMGFYEKAGREGGTTTTVLHGRDYMKALSLKGVAARKEKQDGKKAKRSR